jgi:hypothetical protein
MSSQEALDSPNRKGSILQAALSIGKHGPLFPKAKERVNERRWKLRIHALAARWPEMLIFTLAILGTIICFLLLHDSEYNSADQAFYQQAVDRGIVLGWEMNRVLGDLQTVTAFMSVSHEWRQETFREKFKNLTAGILSRSPGTQGLTWVPMITDASDRAFLEEQVNRQLNLGGSPQQMRNAPQQMER